MSTGTGIITRRRPRWRAYSRMSSPVGDAVGPADLDDPAPVEVELDRLDEVVEHVLDRDRLGQGPHPARRDHDRQPVDQRADHLEGGAAGADDDRRAQLEGRRRPTPARIRPTSWRLARWPERSPPPRRGRRGRRCAAPRRARAAAREGLGAPAVGVAVVGAGGHRVDQVVGRVDARERGVERARASRRRRARPRWPGRRAPASSAGRRVISRSRRPPALEARAQPPADVAGGPGQEDQRRVGRRGGGILDARHSPQANLAGGAERRGSGGRMRVAVVGAGLAGLAAARELRAGRPRGAGGREEPRPGRPARGPARRGHGARSRQPGDRGPARHRAARPGRRAARPTTAPTSRTASPTGRAPRGCPS